MIRNYLLSAWRNLVKNKAHSVINISGLSVGIATVMLIGLWIRDEISFDRYHENHDRIAQVMQQMDFNGVTRTQPAVPPPLYAAMKAGFGDNFKSLVQSSFTWSHVLRYGDKLLFKTGNFMDVQAPEMFTLKMIQGNRDGLKDPASILLSQSLATAIFGRVDPMNKTLLLDNNLNVKVTGIYEDLPGSTTLKNVLFIAPWQLYASSDQGLKEHMQNWGYSGFQLYAQLNDQADVKTVSEKIKHIKSSHIQKEDAKYKPVIFLQPMNKWHLYAEFKNGVNTGGKIEFVWLFGMIGCCVLLLACVNFMNLSTARSEKRSREVGVRKAIGSLRSQLIWQFFTESMLAVSLAFVVALVLVLLTLPFFNTLAGKQISVPWNNLYSWIAVLAFILVTAFIAGSYPAFYLSAFQPVKVLKGVFKAGRFSALPRKILVVLQFTVSIVLIIGTMVVYNQIQFAKNRPTGYSRENLLAVNMTDNGLARHIDVVKDALLKSGQVSKVSASTSPTTAVYDNISGLSWNGKDPNMSDQFAVVGVSNDFGKTVGWQFVAGRDFSPAFAMDSLSVVINETAVQYMGFKNPVGELLKADDRTYRIIGVVRNMLMESPYQPVKQTLFMMDRSQIAVLNIKLKPGVNNHEALVKIEAICKLYAPNDPFNYRFADDEYAKKFEDEEQVGKLAAVFAVLAIFISSLGLFGMATFLAEQRIKEIGVRKVLGASVFDLWQLLSADFIKLIIISFLIAAPLAYYFMHNWLNRYEYRTEISWWVFAIAAMGALLITLSTISYQSLKAAFANPVKSLKTE